MEPNSPGPKSSSSDYVFVMIYDSQGKPYAQVGHELALESDAKGDTKVDALGNLTGGRKYRIKTFVVPARENKLFMLASEAARCVGLKDGYVLFRNHPRLLRVQLTEEDYADYAGQYALTALSVFREFGALVIVGGRRVTDDYYEDEALVKYQLGDLADPHDRLPPPGEPYNVEQWGGPEFIPLAQSTMRESWLAEHASDASKYNSHLNRQRAGLWAPEGVYEGHTGLNFYAQDSQPRNPRWTKVGPSEKAVTVSTVIQSKHRITTTGLAQVDPSIYASLDEDTLKAIKEQIAYEQTV